MVFGFGKKKELQVYSLKGDDILYFSHIPKTAGTTLIEIIDKYFDPKSVLEAHDWQHLLSNMPIDFSKYRFVRGHFGYSIIKFFPKKPVCITILREPIETMISSYKMSKRQSVEAKRYSIPPDLSLSELILKKPLLRNRQAHYLVADMDVLTMTKGLSKEELQNYFPEHHNEFYLRDMSDTKLLEAAKHRLLEFAFVGLVEKMEESLFLLHYTFGWKPIQKIPKKNVSPSDQSPNITKKAREKLLEISEVDRKLYEFANELFNYRYSQMVKELGEKYYQPRFDKMSSNDAVYEMLKMHYSEMKNLKVK